MMIMTKHKFHAVEFVRVIRDRHYRELKGKTPQERIAFYREKARQFHAKLNQEEREKTPLHDLVG